MAWRLLNNPNANEGNNTLVVTADWGACCDDTDVELVTCVITGHNANSDPIASVTINGTVYPFAAAAGTAIAAQTGINAALESAGFLDVEENGTFVSGANTAVYIAVTTSAAALTRVTTSGAVQVPFVCS